MKSFAQFFWQPRFTVTSLAPVQAQWVVFDPQNYAQDLIQAAARAAADQQPDSVASERSDDAAEHGDESQSLNTSQLGTMVTALTQISTLMNQGQGIAFNVNATNTAFTQTYPQSYPTGRRPRHCRRMP